MQNYALGDPFIVLSLESIITLLLLVSYGLYRYSSGVRYKLWALGWMTYTISSLFSMLKDVAGLTVLDGIIVSGMFVGSILLFDGAIEHRRKGRELLVYIIAPAIGISTVQIGIFLGISYAFIFSFFGVVTTFSCWYSANQFRKLIARKSLDFWVAYTGFIVWGFSTLLFLPSDYLNLLDIQVLITSTGIIATGAGLLSYFIRNTTKDLSAQYQIAQLLGSILSHDVRNYVGSLSESINQAIASEPEREMWLELALEIVTSMTDFVMEMRYLTSTVTRVESEKIPMNLSSILEEVSTRVAREYSLEPEKIAFELDENQSILSCAIVKELFWNIFDNAFKHG
ncbi:MAG: HAMP domain-containing histidine kinase, partial [Candidatus Thorarchaeota archaeon]